MNPVTYGVTATARRAADHWDLTLNNGEALTVPTLDDAVSRIRTHLDALYPGTDHREVAVLLTVAPDAVEDAAPVVPSYEPTSYEPTSYGSAPFEDATPAYSTVDPLSAPWPTVAAVAEPVMPPAEPAEPEPDPSPVPDGVELTVQFLAARNRSTDFADAAAEVLPWVDDLPTDLRQQCLADLWIAVGEANNHFRYDELGETVADWYRTAVPEDAAPEPVYAASSYTGQTSAESFSAEPDYSGPVYGQSVYTGYSDTTPVYEDTAPAEDAYTGSSYTGQTYGDAAYATSGYTGSSYSEPDYSWMTPDPEPVDLPPRVTPPPEPMPEPPTTPDSAWSRVVPPTGPGVSTGSWSAIPDPTFRSAGFLDDFPAQRTGQPHQVAAPHQPSYSGGSSYSGHSGSSGYSGYASQDAYSGYTADPAHPTRTPGSAGASLSTRAGGPRSAARNSGRHRL